MNGLERLSAHRVSEALERRPLFSGEERVSVATGELLGRRIYEVFVRKGSKLALATVRDILRVRNPGDTKLRTVSHFVPSVSETTELSRAARLMFDYRLRAIPVRATDSSVEVISAAGIARLIASSNRTGVEASEVMTPHPVTVSPTDTALKARELMLRRNFDHLPVLNGMDIQGVLTSHGLLGRLLPARSIPPRSVGVEKELRLDFPVSKIVESSFLQVPPDDDIAAVASRMLTESRTCALVSIWGELQGIITLRDVISLLKKPEKKALPLYIVGLPNEPFESEAAKMKLERAVSALSKVFPFIEEVRAVVKSKEVARGRKRYEVSLSLYTPKEMFSFSESGYELPELFDVLLPRVKRLLYSKQSRVTRSHGDTLRKED